MALKPRYSDITFFDIKTMQPRCTFNQCVDKFEPCDYVPRTTPQRGRPMPVKVRYYYKCNDCGQIVEDVAPEDQV